MVSCHMMSHNDGYGEIVHRPYSSCISKKSNRNSIEFSLSTWTWSRFKLSWLKPYTYYTRECVEKYHMIKVTGHSHKRKSHDDHRKVVYRLCSSCISSVQEITGTLLGSLCQLALGE